MKRKLAVFMAVVTVITAVFLPGVFYARAAYFPTTPIEFEFLNLALFSQLDLTTGTNSNHDNDNWKYYYRCPFTPQYSAEYTVTVTTRRKMKTELYDAQGTLISASYSPDEMNENYRYVHSHTAYLEKGQTYYYEFAFTNGYYDSCGPFTVQMTSTPAKDIPQDDYLHLYVNGKKSGSAYELDSYSPQSLLQDLSFRVVFEDGKLYEWKGENNAIASLNGCDIILDLSDCDSSLGTHTVTAHYMGRKVTAQFDIVKCIHDYSESVTNPTWLGQGCTVYTCSKCSESMVSDFTDSQSKQLSGFFSCYNAGEDDADFNAIYDLNSDGYINSRDYTMILKMVDYAESKMISSFNKKRNSPGYDAQYDINSDGIINSRDVVMLRQTIPEPY